MDVYLDQNKWVDLARAVSGHPNGEPYRAVLEIARHGAKAGLVRFPLTSLHYMETLSTGSNRRRQDVGRLMNELSRELTMATSNRLLPGEIDRALRVRWGRPMNLREGPVFGQRAAFAFGEEPFKFTAPAELQVDPLTRSMIEEHFTGLMNNAILDWPLEDRGVPGIQASRELGDRHAREEQELGELIRSGGYMGDRLREVWTGRMVMELMEPIHEAMLRAGISPRLFVELGRDGMSAFLADLPVASAVFEIRYRRHRNPQLGWTRNDVRDMHAMSVAVVHCDVVVTERHVAALLIEAGLDRRNGTTVLTDVAKLAPILVAAA